MSISTSDSSSLHSLCKLLGAIKPIEVRNLDAHGDDIMSTITADSRLAGKGSLFVAVRGTRVDGHSFIPG